MMVFVVLRCSHNSNDLQVIGVYQNREDAVAQCGKKKQEWTIYVDPQGYHYHYVIIERPLE